VKPNKNLKKMSIFKRLPRHWPLGLPTRSEERLEEGVETAPPQSNAVTCPMRLMILIALFAGVLEAVWIAFLISLAIKAIF
jgi:hypothetical protein